MHLDSFGRKDIPQTPSRAVPSQPGRSNSKRREELLGKLDQLIAVLKEKISMVETAQNTRCESLAIYKSNFAMLLRIRQESYTAYQRATDFLNRMEESCASAEPERLGECAAAIAETRRNQWEAGDMIRSTRKDLFLTGDMILKNVATGARYEHVLETTRLELAMAEMEQCCAEDSG